MARRLLSVLLGFALRARSARPTAMALNINEDYKPQNEFKLDPWFSIDIGPRLEFNKAVFYVLVATALTCFTMIYVARRMQERPNRLQTAVEAAFGLMRDNITRGNMDDRMAAKWFPFIATIFLFIWFSNIIGYLPLPTNTEHTVDIFGVQVPSLRALRRDGQPLGPARAHAHGVAQLPRRGHPGQGPRRLPQGLDPRRRRGSRARSRSSSSRSSRTSSASSA